MKLINCNQPHLHQSKWNYAFYFGDTQVYGSTASGIMTNRRDHHSHGPAEKKRKVEESCETIINNGLQKKITCYKLNLSTTFIFLAGWDLNETSSLSSFPPPSPDASKPKDSQQRTRSMWLVPCSWLCNHQLFLRWIHCCLVFGGGPLASVAWLIQRCWSWRINILIKSPH